MIAQNFVLFFVHYFRKGCDGLFKKNFERLCNVRGKSPTTVCVELGLSHSVYSLWTDSTVPRRATLQKIADYFGVTPEELLQDEKKKPPVETEGEYDEDEDFKAFSKVLGDLTPEELQKVLSYAEFVLKQRNP